MKVSKTIALLGLAMLAPLAQAADLDVTVTDVKTAGGRMMVALQSEASWVGKAAPVAAQAVAVTATGSVHLRFSGVPAGSYAISLMHDANGNGELDRNMIGVPTEGYGFSNNPQVMGKPGFEQARFSLDEQTPAQSITIQLR